MGLTKAFRGTAEAGFDLIELPIFASLDWDVALTRSLAAEYGLAVTASLGLTDEIDISSEDSDVVGRGEQTLSDVLDVLHAVGGSHLCGVIYGSMKKHMRTATPTEISNGQHALARLATKGSSLGIKMAIEVVNRHETNIVNTAQQAVTYVEKTGVDNLGVHLDTYHMNIEESGMFQPVIDSSEHLEYVHIEESHRGHFGTGSVDFGSFFRALGHVNFSGPIVFESFSSAVVDPQLTATLGIWRNLCNESADLGGHANTYIRNALRAVETIALH